MKLYALFFGKSYSVQRAYAFFFFLLLPSTLFLSNEPIWDDIVVFGNHAKWTWSDLLGPYDNAHPYWRPLTVLTIAVPNLLGISVWENKLISIVLFFVQGLVAITLLDTYLQSRKQTQDSLALIALAALLALHPVFVESTLWISARADLLVGIFVMSGTFWIVRLLSMERSAQQAPSKTKGLICAIALVWLTCASKDTGLVWVTLAGIAAAILCIQSHANWRNYWISVTCGIVVAIASYLVLRSAVLGQTHDVSNLVLRQSVSFNDRFQLFSEFIVRALVSIFIPFADHSPFRPAGWFAAMPTFWLATIIAICAICIGAIVLNFYRKSQTAAVLILCAIAVIIFHAVIESFADPTVGSILSDRYLGPSASLMFIAIAMVLTITGERTIEAAGKFARLNKPVAIVFLVLLIQSALLWTEIRINWVSNLVLWEGAWKQNRHSRIIAENYSRVNYQTGNFIAAQRIARSWINENATAPVTAEQCIIYLRILEADAKLDDKADGIRYANRAIPIGWCRPQLAKDISYFLMQEQCADVLPFIYRVIAEGEKPRATGAWQFGNQEQKNQFLMIAADAQARCGDQGKISINVKK